MRNVFTKLGIIVAICTLSMLFAVPAFAETVTVDATKTYQGVLTAKVTYDDDFEAGKPVKFTFAIGNTSKPVTFELISLYEEAKAGDRYIINDKAESVRASMSANYLEESFYTAGKYCLEFKATEQGSQTPCSFKIEFTIPETQTMKSVDTIANEVYAQCMAECTKAGDTSDYAIALWLNDWITANAEYDDDMRYVGAEGVLARGTGICEAYHSAYCMLLGKAGIPTRRVSSYEDNHVWTGVMIDGAWYNVDTTWSDTESYDGLDAAHLYFALPSSIMKNLQKNWDGMYEVTPITENPVRIAFKAGSYKYNYFIKTGKIKTYSDAYTTSATGNCSVKAHLAKKETSFSLPVEKAKWPEEYKVIIYSLVAYQLSNESWGGSVSKLAAQYKDDKLTFAVEYVASSQETSQKVPSKQEDDKQTTQTTQTSQTTQTAQTTQAAQAAQINANAKAAPGLTPATATKVSGTWAQSGSKWWFKYDKATGKKQGKAYPANEWVAIKGSVYRFDKNGWMQTGWKQAGGKWHYLGTDGAMKTGWQKSGGKWYYMNAKGEMQTGWTKVGSRWYLLHSKNGDMKTGWQKSGGKWYYLNGSGVMQASKWVGNYWLQKDGTMATSKWVDGGRYYVNASGIWVPGKKK